MMEAELTASGCQLDPVLPPVTLALPRDTQGHDLSFCTSRMAEFFDLVKKQKSPSIPVVQ